MSLFPTAHDKGHFKEELAPVTIVVKKKEVVVDTDEHPRPETTLEKLKKLPSLFAKEGVVTAGTASVRNFKIIYFLIFLISFSISIVTNFVTNDKKLKL